MDSRASAARAKGCIVLFKNESRFDQVAVELPAFPEGAFHLRSVMTGQVLGTTAASSSATGSRFTFRRSTRWRSWKFGNRFIRFQR